MQEKNLIFFNGGVFRTKKMPNFAASNNTYKCQADTFPFLLEELLKS